MAFLWTDSRDQMLRELCATGAGERDIAEAIGRRFGDRPTEDAVHGRRRRLGIPAAQTVRRLLADRTVTMPADEEPELPPADRTYVEKPEPSRTLPPLDLGEELERWLHIPDVHAPFHDKRAWDVMMRAAVALRPHGIVVYGDFVDCYTVSDHDKDPRRATQLQSEVGVANDLLDELDALGAQRKVFCEGNHEDRLPRLLMRNAPALLNTLSMPSQLRLAERGWQHIPYRSHARIGKLYVTHEVGHAGVHAVHHTGNAFRHNVAFGHTHRLAVSYFGSVTGERHVAASLGWLGDHAAATYAHEAKKAAWQLGFGVTYMEKSGNVHLRAIPIVDYRCVMDAGLVIQ